MPKDNRFHAEKLQTGGPVYTQIITDKETGVQYLLAISPAMGSGITVLVDGEGKPLLAPTAEQGDA
jgi:hypothetical protein